MLAMMLAVIEPFTVQAASNEATSADSSTSQSWPADIDITAPSACVIDVDSGEILYEKDDKTSHYPASITKIMTALVALENSSLDETVTFSSDAVFKNEGGTSHIARDLDEQMTMEQCLYGMLLESANECAWAIAEHVGGTEPQFVDMMNAKAKELGCVNTHFANPNGLHDDNHWTCAYDMALIARAAYQNPEFAKITGTKQYEIPPTNKHADPTPLNNHHCMLNFYKTSKYLYDGCVGGKTGYTEEAHYTLVTYVKKSGMTLASVVMAEPDQNSEYTDTIALMDHFTNGAFQSCVISDYQNEMKVTVDAAIRSMANNGKNVKADYTGNMILPAGVTPSDCKVDVCRLKEGTSDAKGRPVVARLDYSYAGHAVGAVNLVYTGSGKYDFSSNPSSGKNTAAKSDGNSFTEFIKNHAVLLVLMICMIVLAIVLFFILKLRRDITRSKDAVHRMSCEEREEILKRIKERKEQNKKDNHL